MTLKKMSVTYNLFKKLKFTPFFKENYNNGISFVGFTQYKL